MHGPGKTRIDAILAHQTSAHLVDKAEVRWQRSLGFDHACLAVRLNVPVMSQKVKRLKHVIPISLQKSYYDLPDHAAPDVIRDLRRSAEQFFLTHTGNFMIKKLQML